VPLFQTIDDAFIETDASGVPRKVVTASPPFSGFSDMLGLLGPSGLLATAFANRFILMVAYAQYNVAEPLAGVLTGRVQRARRSNDTSPPDPVTLACFPPASPGQPSLADTATVLPGAQLRRVDAEGNFTGEQIGVTDSCGRFTFWDEAYTGGTIRVAAIVSPPANSQAPPPAPATSCPATETAGDLVRCVDLYEGNPQDFGSTALRFYRNIATGNITFPATTEPPRPPVIDIRIYELVGQTRQLVPGGLLTLGKTYHVEASAQNVVASTEKPAVRGIRIGDRSCSATIEGNTAKVDLATDSCRPTQVGSYSIIATAVPIGASPGGAAIIEQSRGILVVNAGSSNTQTIHGAPRVINWVPRANLRGVPVGALIQVSLSEPVRLNGALTLHERRVDTSGTVTWWPVPSQVLGLGPDGESFSGMLEPTRPLVSVVVQPYSGLRHDTVYEIRIAENTVVDLDVPPSPLEGSLTSSFWTFEPEDVGQSTEEWGSPGIVLLEDRAYLVKNNYAQGIMNGNLRVFDLTDPIEPRPLMSPEQPTEATVTWRPVDMAGELNSSLTDGKLVVVATGPTNASKPSNVYAFDVSSDSSFHWFAATSLTSTATEGFITRLRIRDGIIYTTTFRKGIQILDLRAAASIFRTSGSEYASMIRSFNTDGQGYGAQNVTSIPVMIPPAVQGQSPKPAYLQDLQADVFTVGGGSETLVLATGEYPLVVYNALTQAALYTSPRPLVAGDNKRLTWGEGIGLFAKEGRKYVLLAGQGSVPEEFCEGEENCSRVVVILEMTTTGTPEVRGAVGVPTGAAITDIVVRGDLALVATASRVYMVSLADVNAPRVTGSTDQAGGRIALGEYGLLFSTSRSIFGAPSEGGTVRIAALGPIALVEGTDPKRVVVGEDHRIAEESRLRFRVIPADYELEGRTARIEYVVPNTTARVGQPISVDLGPDGRGSRGLEFGFPLPRFATNFALPRLVINAGRDTELMSPPRAWKTDEPEVEFEWSGSEADPQTNQAPVDESVTADVPTLDVAATSPEWHERAQQATPDAAAVQRSVAWRVLGVGGVNPTSDNDASGLFETLLAASADTALGEIEVEARIGDVVLGRTDPVEVIPGVAAQMALSGAAPIPNDGVSEVTLELTAKDGAGNPVPDETVVAWEEVTDGVLVQADALTRGGRATARLRAGYHFPGRGLVRAVVDRAVAEVSIEQLPVTVTLTPAAESITLDDTEIRFRVEARTPEGPVSNDADLSIFSNVGAVEQTQRLVDGVGEVRWSRIPRMQWRERIVVYANLGSSRAFAMVRWFPVRGSSTMAANAAGSAAAPDGASVIATVEPSMIVGDSDSDGTAAFEHADGTVEQVPFKARAAYRLRNLPPGGEVVVRLGSVRNPNVAPVAAYGVDGGVTGATLVDEIGEHDGDITGVVKVVAETYKGEALRFDGQGQVVIAHAEDLNFDGGYLVQAAVKPSLGGATVQNLIEKAGEFALTLVSEADGVRARFTVETADGPATVTSGTTLSPSMWSEISGRYEGGRLAVIVGDVVDEVSVAEPVQSAEAVKVARGFTGSIDEVRLFDLGRPPLSTFANGSATLSFVADETGYYETEVVSTGSLGTVESGGLLSMRAAQTSSAGEPSVTDRTLRPIFTDVRAEITTYGVVEESQVWFVSQAMAIAFFKFVEGLTAGTGNELDPFVLAGDLFGTTRALGWVVAREVINSGERIVNGQAGPREVFAMTEAVLLASGQLLSSKIATVRKLGRLARAGAAGGSDPLLRVIAKEAAALAAAEGRLKRVGTLVRLMEVGELAVAVGTVVRGLNQEEQVDYIEQILANAENEEEVLLALAEARSELSDEEYRTLIEALGTGYTDEMVPHDDALSAQAPLRAQTLQRVQPMQSAGGAAQPAAVSNVALRQYLKATRETLRGAAVTVSDRLAGLGIAQRRALLTQIVRNFGPSALDLNGDRARALLSRIAGAYRLLPTSPAARARALESLGTALKVLHRGGRASRVGQEFNFQMAVADCLSDLVMEEESPHQMVAGKKFWRVYDHVCRIAGRLTAVKREVKRWVDWPTFPPTTRGMTRGNPEYYAMLTRVRALRRAKQEFFKSIAIERGEFMQNTQWVIAENVGDAAMRAKIVAHFKAWLPAPPKRNPQLLKYFGDDVEGYDRTIRLIRAGDFNSLFKFAPVQ
jgi:hypothetical protein